MALSNASRVYEDIEPAEKWAREELYDTLIIYLHGFRKENLRIQVTSSRNVRVLGERPVGHDNKWQRFRKEFPIPSNCDTNDISAKFEDGILYVKLPKMIAPAVEIKDKVPKTPAEAPKPPATEAPKIPKEAPKQPTEAPKLQKPISTSQQPQLPKTNAGQEQVKKSDGSLQADGSSTTTYVPPRRTEKEKEKEREHTTQVPSKGNESKTTHVKAEASNAVAQMKEKGSQAAEKLEEIRGKKRVEDSAKEDYNGAIFGHGNKNAGVDKYCKPLQGYKQALNGLVMDLKQQPRKMVNLGLAFIFVLILGLYVKHAVTSIREFKRDEL